MNPTSTPSHCSRSLGFDCHIMPLIDVETKECIEHVSEQEEEGMKGNEPFIKAPFWGANITYSS